MKQVIVLMGILPFLMVFMLQYGVEQQNHYKLSQLQQFVYEAKEQAKQDGCFTAKNIETLRERIAAGIKIPREEILIEATITPKYRVNGFDEREMIHYKVQVPIDNLMAGASFFGIDKKENRMLYTIENVTASELIGL